MSLKYKSIEDDHTYLVSSFELVHVHVVSCMIVILLGGE